MLVTALSQVLRRGRTSSAHAAHLDWPKRLNMAMDAAKGMLHLHLCDPPIIHRDLKSPNLLVDKHWRVKVGAPPWSVTCFVYSYCPCMQRSRHVVKGMLSSRRTLALHNTQVAASWIAMFRVIVSCATVPEGLAARRAGVRLQPVAGDGGQRRAEQHGGQQPAVAGARDPRRSALHRRGRRVQLRHHHVGAAHVGGPVE